ncbi:Ubiquinone biosynthesis protein COQ9 [Hibiscus syriacus]|uniref:Ubiquinone biosynthesis protein COQ9 n=1 Tax=Hibiscus syriacus TaxID=106335 RepID=A0A6A2Z799_HIBSY|nr:pollen receptor-like kinase 3 [Hibiscus syriacus]KAE8687577.1 Ubiquinone biosynthesis protein COQ9 [Hibiscus syriacus]
MSTAVVSSLVLILLTLFLFSTLCFSQPDAVPLLKFKKSLKNGDSKLKNWIPNSSPCRRKWVGVMCVGETIIGLHLTNLGLSGSIDVEALSQLRSLRTIRLVKNAFTGPIPEFNKLGGLKAIYLSNNQFTGEIPDTYFGSMRKLKKVWLNENKFTGNIPSSLMQLSNLVELHLQGNQFSGKIPELKYPDVLKSLDLKGNQLEGNIPKSMSKFNASTFEGNVRLCGEQLDKACPPSPLSNKPTSPSTLTIIVTYVTFFVVFFFVITKIASTIEERDENLKNLTNFRETLKKVHVVSGSTRHTSIESSRKSSSNSLSLKIRQGSSQKGNKNKMDDLIMVNEEKGAFGFEDLMKAEAEVLGNGPLGLSYKAVLENGLPVVVKRMREMNKLGKDEFIVLMKRFGEFKHPNILTPLAFHVRKEEKLIISEYMPCGSLSYALHGDRGFFHGRLNWQNRLKIIKGIANGLGYIHTELATNVVPHGNLKSSNVLLTESYDPLLSDYGFHTLVNSDRVVQGLLAFRSPECLQIQQHASPNSDVYCLGIVILEIMTGKHPSQYLNDDDSGIDIVQWAESSISENHGEELIDPEILSSGIASIDQMIKIIRIGVACTKNNPDQRLSLNDAINIIQDVN